MCKSTWPLAWLPSRCCNYTFVHVSYSQLNSIAVVFQKKLTVLILLMSSSFCLLYTSPVNNAMWNYIGKSAELFGFAFFFLAPCYICELFNLQNFWICNDSSIWCYYSNFVFPWNATLEACYHLMKLFQWITLLYQIISRFAFLYVYFSLCI